MTETMEEQNSSNRTLIEYSCLMSVYKEDNPSYFDLSLQNMENQTRPPSEYIVMLDGPVGSELHAVLDRHKQKVGHTFHIIQLEHNMGLHGALRIGVEHCTYDWIARMDPDDYSDPHRIELQEKFLARHPDYDAVGTLCNEFISSPNNPICLVRLPETDASIRKFAKLRDPCRHPSMLYRKSAVLAAGNYQDYPYFEDYDLFVRMLMNGSKFYNIQKPLVGVRVSADFYSRRGGWSYATDMARFKWHLHTIGFLTVTQALKTIIPHGIICIAPGSLREWVYKHLLRERNE